LLPHVPSSFAHGDETLEDNLVGHILHVLTPHDFGGEAPGELRNLNEKFLNPLVVERKGGAVRSHWIDGRPVVLLVHVLLQRAGWVTEARLARRAGRRAHASALVPIDSPQTVEC